MNTCPNCSHSLLLHLHVRDRYWYCQHCRLKTPDSFLTATNKSKLHESFYSSCDRSSLIAFR